MIVISYPKSGLTWLLGMLSNYYEYYFTGRDFSRQTILSIEKCEMKYDNWVMGYHDVNMQLVKKVKEHYNKRVVYLIRDPRDCLVSLYFYRAYCKNILTKRIKFRIKTTLSHYGFVRKTLEAWKQHVRTYKDECDQVISYEELINDCTGSLSRLTGTDDMSRLGTVVDENSFQAHSGREQGQENKYKFARKGIVGDWNNYYSDPKYKKLIKDIVGQELIQFGYEKDFNW